MKQDIEIVRGTSNTFDIEVTDANGDPYTLADGEQIIFGVKKKPEHGECLIKKVSTACTDGVCTIEIDPEDTLELPFGKYFYDVGLRSGSDFFQIIGCEKFKLPEFHILPNITKWGDGE